MDPSNLKCYGIWRVTTEGDCEGRTIRELGTFEGFLDEIAFKLGGDAYYMLTFDPAELRIESPKKPVDQVHITLGIQSRTWDKTPEGRVKFFEQFFAGRNVDVSKSYFYAGVLLSKSQEIRISAIRKQALEKLSDEERKVLGL